MWIIRTVDESEGGFMYWSNEYGWTDLEQATRFTDEERRTLRLPVVTGCPDDCWVQEG